MLTEAGPVSNTMSKKYPLHQYMLDSIMESLSRGEVDKDKLNIVTTKAIYKSRMGDLLDCPKVESKFPQVNFSTVVYPRLKHPMLEAKQKDFLFTILHGIYMNRERLFEQKRAESPLCLNKACTRWGLAQSVEHIFCSCYRVRAVWQWTRRKLLELLADQGVLPLISNTDILMLMFPKNTKEAEVMFVLGNYVELVDRETIGKEKELLVCNLLGYLSAKSEQVKARAVPEINLVI